ncbi:MAG TPA: methyltransferase domain-containing protein [Gemmataceae bacterium]|jgi:23S rRNA G2445 N2-methylase RlmL|nr:methyltransferase domain-containing protein [Gemmataceae bacterium]
MARQRAEESLPACYAMVHSGLEEIAADEITRDLAGEVKKASHGIVAFRLPELGREILKLRTVEDVFLFGWGTNDLTHRPSVDLDRIRNWTRKVHWDRLLQIHHAIHPKPKGKPTYRLITQMSGEHGYRRIDAGEALAQGLKGVFPASWKPAQENAAVEVWLTIRGQQAVCGLRLSDRTMRHRSYKQEHLPASLRPSVAAAMVRLAGTAPGMTVLDPMCGAGTILAEQAELARQRGAGNVILWGGDIDRKALRAATSNLRKFQPERLEEWDVRKLPIADASVDRIISNPPFGRQLGAPEEIAALYRAMIVEMDRVLKPEGRAVLQVGDATPLLDAISPVGWQAQKQYRIRILGLPAFLSVWRKRYESSTVVSGEA